MKTVTTITLPIDLQPLAAMGMLLERLERLPRTAAPSQYRDVVMQVQRLLGEAEPGAAFDALLAGLPATAELYENMNYAYAGLCRSPPEAALSAEVAARLAIAKIGGPVG